MQHVFVITDLSPEEKTPRVFNSLQTLYTDGNIYPSQIFLTNLGYDTYGAIVEITIQNGLD